MLYLREECNKFKIAKERMEMLQAHQGYLNADVQLIADNNALVNIPKNKKITIFWEEIPEKNDDITKFNDEEIAKRQAIFDSLKGCLAGQEIDLERIREERLGKRGLL